MRENTRASMVLIFVREHVAEYGEWPSNKDICRECRLMPWRLGSILDQLRRHGKIGREKVDRTSPVDRRQYRYWLMEHEEVDA